MSNQVNRPEQQSAEVARINGRMAEFRKDPALRYEDRRWDDLEFEQQAGVRRYVAAGRLTWETRADGKTYVVALAGAQS